MISETVKKILLYLLAFLVGAASLMPFLWMVSASFMPSGSANTYPPKFLPDAIDFSHYISLFSRIDLTRNLLNSLVISIGVTFFSLFFNSLTGYAFAKLRFAGKESIFKVMLSSMIIPGQVTMLPVFLMLKNMGLINTYWAIIVPAMSSVFGIFLIRQFAMSIPDSLIEAAKIDGAGEFEIYFRIILPLIKPIIITLGIFTFMGSWNDFLWPLIVMTDSSMYTMPVALSNLMGEHVQDTELMMAGSVITILPVIIIFIILQRFYINGILMGSVKG
ncbi:MAG: carbohydrate ABC transporter permease [Ignavibacteriales bacterium]|nr:carbohydrate ABC transporter permease [Ignavibacteriales bacterium]